MTEIAYSGQGDRRVRQRDPVVQTLQMLSFLSICIIALLAFLIALAQPASYAVIHRRSGPGAAWDPVLCMALVLLSCRAGAGVQPTLDVCPG